MDDQIRQLLSRIEAQNGVILEQHDDLASGLKELSEQIHRFHIVANSHDHHINSLKSSHQEIINRLDLGADAMKTLQRDVVTVQHGQETAMQRVESFLQRDEENRGEISKLWDYVGDLNTTLSSTNTRISTSTALISAVGGILFAVVMALCGYFGTLVIEDSKKIAIMENSQRKPD